MARCAESPTETRSEKRSASTGRTTSQPDGPEECARIVEASERDENELRSQIIEQLEQSLAMSREMMMNQKLDPKTREKWTQLHTNTAQVLNTVLRDKQYQEWERRLKELEAAGRIPRKPAGSVDGSSGASGRRESP